MSPPVILVAASEALQPTANGHSNHSVEPMKAMAEESVSVAPLLETLQTPTTVAQAGPTSSFQLLQQWHSQPRKLRIIHVGAGATGLCAAFKMERQLTDYELVCYDKNSEIGGTWLVNRYPGCACDVPAHIYTYTFEPKADWSSYYAGSAEIQQYFLDFCEKYNLRRYIKLEHKVLSATWHEDKGQYEVLVEHAGETFTDWCDILVNGSGMLSHWRWPDITGLHDFKGELYHSAQWDESASYANKRVAVVGRGSSAIQVIPQVAKTASELKCIFRGSNWVAPPMARIPVEAGTAEDGSAVFDDTEAAQPSTNQYFFTEREIQRLKEDPALHLDMRKRIEMSLSINFAVFYKGSEASKMARYYMDMEMKRRLAARPDIAEKMVPNWAVGCRRLGPGDGYLEALTLPTTEVCFDGIKRVNERGFETPDGRQHDVDMIICATGYDVSWTPHFELFGRKGLDIKEAWSPEPRSYLGLAAPGFPNYFVMNGARGNLANGTALPCFETLIDYVVLAARKMQSDRIKSLDVRGAVVDQLNEYVDAWHETSVFSEPCRSWYKNNTTDGKVRTWGGSSIHYLKTIKTPRWEHYDIEYLDDNMWSFLGNGRIKAEVHISKEALTPYLRNSDTPWTIE